MSISYDTNAPFASAVSEPSMNEVIYKRRIPFAEVMMTSITLEELDGRLSDKIYRHYHPES